MKQELGYVALDKRGAELPVRVVTELCCVRARRKTVVAWTDDKRLLPAVAEGGSAPKPLEPLYRWWTTHS